MPTNQTSSALKSFVSYVIQYGFSAFLGTIGKAGAVADFTIGSIFSILNAPSNILSSTSDPFYTIDTNSVTDMTYTYVYDSSYLGWRLIGVHGDVAITRSSHVSCNLNGSPYQNNGPISTTTGYSGLSWFQYIETWVTYKNAGNPGFCYTAPLGSFTIKGYYSTFTYTPKFVSLPGYL